MSTAYPWVTLRDPAQDSGNLLDASLTDAEYGTGIAGKVVTKKRRPR